MSQSVNCIDGPLASNNVRPLPGEGAYSTLTATASLDLDEIDVFRKRLIQNLSELKLNKHRFKTHDFNQLQNYHNYALGILNNMQNIRQVEMNNPYNQNMLSLRGSNQPTFETINPYTANLKVIYKRDGTTQVMTVDDYESKFVGEWNAQFSNDMINPPSYTLPPNNCWATNRQRYNETRNS